MSDNLKIWDQFADIDPKFTKPITGKDYSGTSANPQYMIKCLTELFGPIGIGFGWDVVAESIERFGDTAIHWCRIDFWHTDRANTFQAYGQTKMAYMTRGGNAYLKVDEDAPKKSLTDAVTKAASQVGIASNIFLGRWDDSKYVEEVNAKFRDDEKPAPYDSEGAKERLLSGIAECATVETLKAFYTGENDTLQKITDEHFGVVKSAYQAAGVAMSDAAKKKAAE